MPGFDRTGPEGKGARTGRQAGKCNPENETEPEDTRQGRRRGRGLKLRLRNQADSPGNQKGNRPRRRW
ncbi:MAG TPA: DUF5320 domain-containing protein [Tangfeifania sp.]|nr:DUF5320 domain-containing protein [Tangfeifania sp.]